MKYHIRVKVSGEHKVIASFEHEADRDVCLDAFEEYWQDAKFDAVEDD